MSAALCSLLVIPICEDVCRIVSVSPPCMCVSIKTYPGEETGHLGEMPPTEMSHLSIKCSSYCCAEEEEEEEEEKSEMLPSS